MERIACPQCGTPQHLFYHEECPRCILHHQPRNVSMELLLYMYTWYAASNKDPREFEYDMLKVYNAKTKEKDRFMNIIMDAESVGLSERLRRHDEMLNM